MQCSGAVSQLTKTITASISWNNLLLNLQIPHRYCRGNQNIGKWWAIWILGRIVLKPAYLEFTCQCDSGLECDHCCVLVVHIQASQLWWAIVRGLSQQEIILSVRKRGKPENNVNAFSIFFFFFLLRIRNKYIYNFTNRKGERLFLAAMARCSKNLQFFLFTDPHYRKERLVLKVLI